MRTAARIASSGINSAILFALVTLSERGPFPCRKPEQSMSDAAVTVSGGETRQSMIRVWMAISAVWVAFWLLIAAIVMLSVEFSYPLGAELRPFSAIVVLPPLALLFAGIVCRWTYCSLLGAARFQMRKPSFSQRSDCA